MTEPSTRDAAFRAAVETAVVCTQTGLAPLRFEGEDASAFLQGQLSSDVEALMVGKSQWSSYNSAKGRMLANLRLWREAGALFGALTAADLAATTQKRLSLFVLRAKARIVDQSATHAVIGIAGPAAAEKIQSVFAVEPRADDAVVTRDRRATVIGLGDARFAVAAEAALAPSIATEFAKVATIADEAIWRWLSIRDGVPLVTKETSDQFVPQMLNWDALGGISFQKGCYPGQEIVARMRYLGRLKERLYGFRVKRDHAVETGARIYGPAFGETPCGSVVSAAPSPDCGHALLAVVQMSAVETGGLTLDAIGGSPLAPFALPYTVFESPARSRLG